MPSRQRSSVEGGGAGGSRQSQQQQDRTSEMVSEVSGLSGISTDEELRQLLRRVDQAIAKSKRAVPPSSKGGGEEAKKPDGGEAADRQGQPSSPRRQAGGVGGGETDDYDDSYVRSLSKFFSRQQGGAAQQRKTSAAADVGQQQQQLLVMTQPRQNLPCSRGPSSMPANRPVSVLKHMSAVTQDEGGGESQSNPNAELDSYLTSHGQEEKKRQGTLSMEVTVAEVGSVRSDTKRQRADAFVEVGGEEEVSEEQQAGQQQPSVPPPPPPQGHQDKQEYGAASSQPRQADSGGADDAGTSVDKPAMSLVPRAQSFVASDDFGSSSPAQDQSVGSPDDEEDRSEFTDYVEDVKIVYDEKIVMVRDKRDAAGAGEVEPIGDEETGIKRGLLGDSDDLFAKWKSQERASEKPQPSREIHSLSITKKIMGPKEPAEQEAEPPRPPKPSTRKQLEAEPVSSATTPRRSSYQSLYERGDDIQGPLSGNPAFENLMRAARQKGIKEAKQRDKELKQLAALHDLNIHPSDVRMEISNRLELCRTQLTKIWARSEGLNALLELLRQHKGRNKGKKGSGWVDENTVGGLSRDDIGSLQSSIKIAEDIATKMGQITKNLKVF